MEMAALCRSLLLLSLLSLTTVVHAGDNAVITIRVVTWNVEDNEFAEGKGFTEESIDAVLGLDTKDVMPSIYAVGLQENCWMCNGENMDSIWKLFLKRIKAKDANYQFIALEATKNTKKGAMATCEKQCAKMGKHGTTLVMVFAKNSVVPQGIRRATRFHLNDKCSSQQLNWLGRFGRDSEKGFAGLMVYLKNGKTICFASAHLDSQLASWRQKCFKEFFKDANAPKSKKGVNWFKECNAQYLFGDFNTRTAGHNKEKKCKNVENGVAVKTGDALEALKDKDELTGTNPWSGKENLLHYINNGAQTSAGIKQKACFKEGFKEGFKFNPTYSLLPTSKCENGAFPCYCTVRPQSWTDRIIYTKGELLEYKTIENEKYGDHLPVYAKFEL